jgi:uncharacterized protein with ATP-grasp and redox domains
MIDVNCIPCLRQQADRLFKKYKVPGDRLEILTDEFNRFLDARGKNNPAPLSAQFLNKLVKEETGIEDLYLEEKDFYNRALLERYSDLKYDVDSSPYPPETALKYALAGNIIDFGPPREFNLNKTFEEALNKDLAVDNSELLFEAVKSAQLVLYLGDNAGEIVTDRLFIETLNHPNVYFAVRGTAVLNDVTIREARFVEMHRVAKIIDNGSGAPSTLLDSCSPEFQDIFEKADVVISKGQGNFEGLFGKVKKPDLFFLFMVKCPEIARVTGQKVGDAVILRNRN